MQKGIVMRVDLYITGEDAPAHDFTQTGREVALDVLRQGLQHYQGAYAIQVRQLAPVEGGDDDDESGGDALDVKPLLSYTPSGQQFGSAPATTPSAQDAPPAPAAPPSPPTAPPARPATDQRPQPSSEQPEKHHFWDR
jgi:hypothetical protein